VTHSHYMREEAAAAGTYRLLIGGELDLHSSPRLGEGIARGLESGARLIVVDLTETTFIDSTAIGTLVRAFGWMNEAGVELEIICTNPNVLRIFEVTQLDTLLAIRRPSEGEVVQLPARTAAFAAVQPRK
jgi:anti-sigma B factor antagonist